jgi:hypothetical protein
MQLLLLTFELVEIAVCVADFVSLTLLLHSNSTVRVLANVLLQVFLELVLNLSQKLPTSCCIDLLLELSSWYPPTCMSF